MEKRHKFLTLDALRGLAAVAVFIFHYEDPSKRRFFPHGYLAVDFFFMLSGFVLAYAYQEKLDRGWATLSFLKARSIRLYPLYLLGLGLGLAEVMIGPHATPGLIPGRGLLLLTLVGLLMLPSPVPIQGDASQLFPLNRPSWSLFYEVLANIVHALLLRRRSSRFLFGVVLTAAALLIYVAVRRGSIDFGVNHPVSMASLTRVMFSYVTGVLLLRVWHSGRWRVRVSPFIPVVVLLAALEVGGTGLFRALYDVGATMLIFPLVLLLGASSQPQAKLVRAFEVVGASSYAIYALHYPITAATRIVWPYLRHRTAAQDEPWAGVLTMILVFAAAWAADRSYDLPIRAYLNRKTQSVAKKA